MKGKWRHWISLTEKYSPSEVSHEKSLLFLYLPQMFFLYSGENIKIFIKNMKQRAHCCVGVAGVEPPVRMRAILTLKIALPILSTTAVNLMNS